MPRLEVNDLKAVSIRYEPDNGTSYRLICTADSQGGGAWMWMDGTRIYAAGWYGDDMRVQSGKLNKVDRECVYHALGFQAPQGILEMRYQRSARTAAVR